MTMYSAETDRLLGACLPTLAARGIRVPTYARSGATGVVHLGLGAFHRAHQALVESDNARSEGAPVSNGIKALKILAAPALLPLLVAALLLLLIRPRRPVALAWALFNFAVIAFGVLGRPGIIRIYLPHDRNYVAIYRLRQSSRILTTLACCSSASPTQSGRRISRSDWVSVTFMEPCTRPNR